MSDGYDAWQHHIEDPAYDRWADRAEHEREMAEAEAALERYEAEARAQEAALAEPEDRDYHDD